MQCLAVSEADAEKKEDSFRYEVDNLRVLVHILKVGLWYICL